MRSFLLCGLSTRGVKETISPFNGAPQLLQESLLHTKSQCAAAINECILMWIGDCNPCFSHNPQPPKRSSNIFPAVSLGARLTPVSSNLRRDEVQTQGALDTS